MQTDQIIALAASIGACLSAIAAFFTIKQTSKQRQSSYKPELVISRTKVECFKLSATDDSIPEYWTPKEKILSEKSQKSFYLPLRNIGLGAAKSVELKWSFEINNLINIINDITQKTMEPAYFKYSDNKISLISNKYRSSTSLWSNQKKSSIDYVLPSSIEPAPFELRIPQAFILLISALVHFSFLGNKLNDIPELPQLNLELSYLDIGGKRYTSKFCIKIEIVTVYKDGFFGFVESHHHL